jgi:hypothetical protein
MGKKIFDAFLVLLVAAIPFAISAFFYVVSVVGGSTGAQGVRVWIVGSTVGMVASAVGGLVGVVVALTRRVPPP